MNSSTPCPPGLTTSKITNGPTTPSDNSWSSTSPNSGWRPDGSTPAAPNSSRSPKPDKDGVLAPAPAGAGTLLYLFETTQSELSRMPVANRSATAKKAETLYANLSGLIERVGIERVGFVTLTTADNCTNRVEAQRRFNSFATNVLRPEAVEHIAVPERQERGAIHFHLAAAFPWDIRTGFDFAAVSHSGALKREDCLGGGKWT